MVTDEELRRYRREEVRNIECPYCSSGPGENCIGVLRIRGPMAGKRKIRKSNHLERVQKYLEFMKEVHKKKYRIKIKKK